MKRFIGWALILWPFAVLEAVALVKIGLPALIVSIFAVVVALSIFFGIGWLLD